MYAYMFLLIKPLHYYSKLIKGVLLDKGKHKKHDFEISLPFYIGISIF